MSFAVAAPETSLARTLRSGKQGRVKPAPGPEQSMTAVSRLNASARADLKPATAASLHFKLEPGVDCTGTYISRQGHILTALHCVAQCLARHHALTRSHATDEPVKTVKGRGIYTDLVTVDENSLDAGISCPVWIGKKKLEAKVVLTGGKGWLSPKDTLAAFATRFPNDYAHVLDDGYEHGFDIAILKTEQNTADRCLPLAEAPPPTGAALRTVTYACVDRDNLRADGRVPLLSAGRRTTGFKQSQYYKSRTPASLTVKPEWIDRKDTFFSSLDIEKCGSGSGIFDRDYRVVGVATRVYKSSTLYEYGSLEAVSVAQVWRELYAKASGSDIKEMTSCSRPRARRLTSR